MWHLAGIYRLHHVVADKEQASPRVVDNIVYLFTIELMEYGYYHATIGQRG